MDLIVVKNLVKQFGDFTAVNGINFSVKQGESFGLLGPNGAGKSSTMRIIGATSQRTSGEVLILGKDPEQAGPQIRAHLGVVPQQDNLDEELTCAENLYIYGRYFGLPKTTVKNKLDELLEFAQLLDKKNSKVKSLSGGMKRRLTIARALVSDPDILMLDEPTTGLHFEDVNKLLTVLNRLVDTGNTVVVIEHNLDVIKCSDWVIDMGPEGGFRGGTVVAEGTPETISAVKESYTGQFLGEILKTNRKTLAKK